MTYRGRRDKLLEKKPRVKRMSEGQNLRDIFADKARERRVHSQNLHHADNVLCVGLEGNKAGGEGFYEVSEELRLQPGDSSEVYICK